MAQEKVGLDQGGGGLRLQLSGSKKARGPKPVAVIAAEDGTPLLNDAEIAALWEAIFFQEFSGRGERVQPNNLEGRLRELRIPWQAQLRPKEWPDEDQLAADACDVLGRMRTAKAMGEYCVPAEYLCAGGPGYLR